MFWALSQFVGELQFLDSQAFRSTTSSFKTFPELQPHEYFSGGTVKSGLGFWRRSTQLSFICHFLRYQEALSYLVYAYQSNTTLLTKGPCRGVKESVIALYRRKCLLVGTVCKALLSLLFYLYLYSLKP